jgi:hypothetical protein
VEVRLLYFEDCPIWRLADARLREALAGLGEDVATVTYEQVMTPEDADRAGFRGSPTILVNGRDPFAGPGDPIGLSCRIYRTASSTEHAPTVEQLRSALASAR